jgi:trehalose/maltose transport system substrate-binding protein
MASIQSRYSASARAHWIPSNNERILVALLLAITIGGCRQAPHDPATLSYFRLGWSQLDELPQAEPLAQQFTRETGIRLENLPVPENTLDQLALSRKLLEGGGPGPDVVNVDMIWSGVLEGDLIDMQPYSTTEIASINPLLVPDYTVDGKLVAIPFQVQVGFLEYRSDLLREYGYTHPPKTWDELERMAERIQRGERAKGEKDFWGYVWQGADTEALTCNALEWQAAEGGGKIIEDDRTISVNNPAAIRSWLRAKHWIGWISPPSVVEFRELDSTNLFDSGKAAFNRIWAATLITRTGQSRLARWRDSLAQIKIGHTSIPGGPGGWAGTLGGSGLAVSRHSPHPREAIKLVQFLIRAQLKSDDSEARDTARQLEANDRPSISVTNAGATKNQRRSGIVSRPSSVAGSKYEKVSRAYIAAVHSVITGDKDAPQAAKELETELTKITGFKTGPPKPVD